MYKTSCIKDIKDDFIGIFAESKEAEETECGFIRQMFRGVMELLAPLL